MVKIVGRCLLLSRNPWTYWHLTYINRQIEVLVCGKANLPWSIVFLWWMCVLYSRPELYRHHMLLRKVSLKNITILFSWKKCFLMMHFDWSGAIMVTHFKGTAVPKPPPVGLIMEVSGETGRQTVCVGLTCLRPGISVCMCAFVRVCEVAS